MFKWGRRLQNGTKVPAADNDSSGSRSNKNGEGVLIPSIENKEGEGISTPSNPNTSYGTEVPTPITNENYTSVRLEDFTQAKEKIA